jgi:hypothetical protein
MDATVTSDIYLSLLWDEFTPLMRGYIIAVNTVWLEQDGARRHISNSVHQFLHDVFEDRILSLR